MIKIFGKAYLLLIGLSIAIAFSLVSFIVSYRLNKKIDEVRNIIGRGVFHQKSLVVTNEFQKLEANLRMMERVIRKVEEVDEPRNALPVFKASLPEDSMINRAWYYLIKKQDTVSGFLNHRGKQYVEQSLPPQIVQWTKSADRKSDQSFGLLSVKDSLHILLGEKIRLRQGQEAVFGIDINLKKLNHYFANVDPLGQAYFSIIDQEGRVLCDPDISEIGKVRTDLPKDSILSRVYQGRRLYSEIVKSKYLGIPVKQYYSLFPFRGQNWILIVSTPLQVFEEELLSIRKDTMLLGTLSILIILTIVVLAQRKWLREFQLREDVQRMSEKLKIKTQKLQLEAETREKENAVLQLKVLKDKMDPHFLFNSFGSLNALILRDPDLARQFVVKLSKVYRYILDTKTENLAYVKDELAFADQYYFLLKIRFREALSEIEVDVKPEHLFKHLPFMSVQGAIENAIKHNELSKQTPLRIKIQSVGNGILVTNNYQPRLQSVESTKQGQSYLRGIYEYFETDGYYAEEKDGVYYCFLPLV